MKKKQNMHPKGLVADEIIANAQLIAAASEMLEALKWIKEYWLEDPKSSLRLKDVENSINRAIAKAEGKL